MNRRSFLKILAGTAAASTTTYFLPPIGGWKSDVIAHPEWHVVESGPSEFTSFRCPPGCTDHLHRWQIEQIMARQREFSRSPIVFNGLKYVDYPPIQGEYEYLGIARA